MPALLLRITVVDKDVTKTLRFDKSMTVFDACKYVSSKINTPNAEQGVYRHVNFMYKLMYATPDAVQCFQRLDNACMV